MADSVVNPGSAAGSPWADPCASCGRLAPTKHVYLESNIGLIVMALSQSVSGRLCRRCVDHYFWKFTLTTLFLGWWGIRSFFRTLTILPGNVVAFASTRRLPRAPLAEANGAEPDR
jgi:hypothetical protein